MVCLPERRVLRLCAGFGRRAVSSALALAAAAVLMAGPGCGRRAKVTSGGPRPNVLLIVVDALRADRLGCYGYTRPTSPNLDALAAEGTLFENDMSQAPETPPSVPSILTGMLPREHGMGWMLPGQDVYQQRHLAYPTLAEILQKHGYTTAAICANPVVGPEIGADRGFQVFDYPIGRLSVWLHKSTAQFNAAAEKWAQGYDRRAGPFFLYVHYIATHNLYTPPSKFCVFGRPGYTAMDDKVNVAMNDVFDPHSDRSVTAAALAKHGVTRSDVERLSDLYDDEVLCADYYIGSLLQRLKDRGLYDNTIVIVTADHGEAFLDHSQLKHGGSLYRELLRVPLIVKLPGVRGGRKVEALVRSIDIAPTVLSAADLGRVASMTGQSFYRELAEGKPITSRVGVADLPAKQMAAVRNGDMKLIESPGRVELYDLASDPGEMKDLSRVMPKQVAQLEETLQREKEHHPVATGKTRPPNRKELQVLRSLGYTK